MSSPAQSLGYNFKNPSNPYMYEGISFSKDDIQLRLFGLLGGNSEEFFRVLNVFLLDIDYKGQSANSSYLIWAILIEDWASVEALIINRINVNLTDKWNATALMYAAFCGHVKTVNLLLTNGADPKIQSEYGTAMDYAQRGREMQSCRVEGDYNMTEYYIDEALSKRIWKRVNGKFIQISY